MLDVPLYYVHGNHVTEVLDSSGQLRNSPWGAINLHRKVVYIVITISSWQGLAGRCSIQRGITNIPLPECG